MLQNCDGSIEHIINLSKKFLTTTQLQFFESQLLMNNRVKKGKRWTVKDKLLALRIMYRSPQTFKMLRRIFSLPARSTILMFLEKSFGTLLSGFSNKVMALLKMRVETMTKIERNCSLVFDEMSLKQHLDYDKNSDKVVGIQSNGKPVNQVLVLMVRGLSTKWKQPIAYFYSNNAMSSTNLAKILNNAMVHLHAIGLAVRCLVFDQSSTNIRAIKFLGFSLLNQQILHPTTRAKVYIIFDPPHLIKSIRNNLIQHDIMSDGKIISWKHLQELYNLEKVNAIRLAPKLTDRHLDPGSQLAMRVKLATQIFSSQVSTALNVYASTKLLPENVLPTSFFIKNMDILFDIMNSRKLIADKPTRSALTLNNKFIQQLEDLRVWIKGWHFCGARSLKGISSHWGLDVTITNILCLTNELLHEDFFYVCTAQFNQDCLEIFFALIRSKGGWNDRPTALQFKSAYQNALVLLSIEQSNSNSNCLPESDFSVAVTIDSITNKVFENQISMNEKLIFKQPSLLLTKKLQPCVLQNVSIDSLSQSAKQVLKSIADYLIKKVQICQKCVQVLSSVTSSGDNLFNLLQDMETVFIIQIKILLTKRNIIQQVINEIKNHCNFRFIFDEHVDHAILLKESLVRNFVIMRMSYFIRFYNRDIQPRNKACKKKLARIIHG